jgi:hypothetical protein
MRYIELNINGCYATFCYLLNTVCAVKRKVINVFILFFFLQSVWAQDNYGECTLSLSPQNANEKTLIDILTKDSKNQNICVPSFDTTHRLCKLKWHFINYSRYSTQSTSLSDFLDSRYSNGLSLDETGRKGSFSASHKVAFGDNKGIKIEYTIILSGEINDTNPRNGTIAMADSGIIIKDNSGITPGIMYEEYSTRCGISSEELLRRADTTSEVKTLPEIPIISFSKIENGANTH